MNQSFGSPAGDDDSLKAWHLAGSRIWRLARKELREILRDRRTIITLIAMPILLYPLMSVVFLQFSLASKLTTRAEGEYYRIGAVTDFEAQVFMQRFAAGQRAWRKARGDNVEEWISPEMARTIPHIVWQIEERKILDPKARAAALEEYKEMVREGKLDLLLTISDLDQAKAFGVGDRYLKCQFFVMPNNSMGQAGLAHISTALSAADAENLKERLNLPGAQPRILMLGVEKFALETAASDGLISLSALVPLILILMTITGAVYPAIDLTAGERERGTLEILVAAPVPRFELLTAKYLSVVTVAVLNAIVNLVCMTITVLWSGAAALLPGLGGLTPMLLFEVFLLLLLFAAFFSAVLLCLTSFARSFKEAQAYLIPLMLASLAPGVMAMMPGLKLTGILTVLPLVNIVLMARDLFEGGVDPMHGTIVVLTTLLYALAALALAARVFGAESVLYSEQSSWSDLVRRPEEPQPVASIPAMLWCLALMVPIQFGLQALLRGLPTVPLVAQIGLHLAINVLLFGFLPALFAYLGRVEAGSGLGLALPRVGALIGGLLLGFSLWPLELWLLEQTSDLKNLEDRFGVAAEGIKQTRNAIGLGIMILGIVPAILEEIFFRGFLFNALKARSGPWVTIGVSAILFGVTHVILGGALGMERLVPSLVLGLILGLICWHSGSLWPGMVLHICHNSILLGAGVEEIPGTWVALGSLGAAIGTLFLWLLGRKKVATPRVRGVPS
jgi:sodium transport system permease protein